MQFYTIVPKFYANFTHQAFGSGAMSKVNVYQRFKEFKEGRADYRGKRGQHTGYKRPIRTEENIAKIRDLIAEDARSTLKELSIESGVSIFAVQQIIAKDLGYTKKCARSVSQSFTQFKFTQL